MEDIELEHEFVPMENYPDFCSGPDELGDELRGTDFCGMHKELHKR